MGESIIDQLDLAKAKWGHQKSKRVYVDFPVWTDHSLDKEANLLVSRQSVI